MASRFWVGGTGTWTDTAHWAATSNGTPGVSAPGAADSVFFDSNSGGGSVTLVTGSILSLNCTGFTGSLTIISGGGLNVAGNITLSAAMTLASGSASSFVAMNNDTGTTATLTTNGVVFSPGLEFGRGVTQGTYIIADALNAPLGITLTAGTLHADGATDNAGLSHSWKTFTGNNTNTRSLYLGTASITITGGGGIVWNTNNSAGLTLACGTATITLSGAGASFLAGTGSGSVNPANFYNLSFTGSGTGFCFASSATLTLNTLTITGTAVQTDQRNIGGNVSAINLTIAGNSTTSRLLVATGDNGGTSLGTTHTVSVSGSVTLTNVDFQDITTGGTGWAGATVSGGVGDCGGNDATISGYTPAVAQYWKTTNTTGTKTWSSAANWFTATNGGGGSGRVPLPQDNVFIDANSLAVGTTLVSPDMPRLGKTLDFSGVTQTLNLLGGLVTSYGSLLLSSAVVGNGAASALTANWTFSGRGSTWAISVLGKTFGSATILAPTGTYQFTSSFVSGPTANLTLTAGILDANGNSVTVAAVSSGGSLTRELRLSTSTWTISGGLTHPWAFSGSGCTVTPGSSTVAFAITANGDITSNGQSFNNLTINAPAVTVTLADALTCAGVIALTAGTLNTNSKAVTAATFSSNNANTRTLTITSSTATLIGGGIVVWDTRGTTGLTINATGSTIVLSGNQSSTLFGGHTGANSLNNVTVSGSQGGGSAISASGNTINFNGTLTWTGGGVMQLGSGTYTTVNLTVTGTASKTDSFIINSAATLTVTGTFTLAGNSTTNRLFAQTSILGTQRTVTNTGATMVWSNVDLRDIALSSAYDASAITGGSGDCGGNSGITFTTSASQNWTNTAGGNWSTAANWSGRVPLPQDDVTFSCALAGKTITLDMPRAGRSISFSSATGSPTVAWTTATTLYGSLDLTGIGTFNANATTTWEGRAAGMPVGGWTIRSAGKTFWIATFQAFGATVVLLDAFQAGSGSSQSINAGTFDAAGFNVTLANFNPNTGATVNMGSGTWTLTSTSGVVWNCLVGATINAQTSTIVLSDTGSSAKTFAGGGKTYNNLTIAAGGTGAVTISGSNTFNVTTINAPKTVTFSSGTTQTVQDIVATGSVGNSITLNSSTPGSPATLSKSSGTVSCDYLSLKDSTATGGASWYAGNNSANVSGNTGWLFQAPPQTYNNAVGLGLGLATSDSITAAIAGALSFGAAGSTSDGVRSTFLGRTTFGTLEALSAVANGIVNEAQNIGLSSSTSVAPLLIVSEFLGMAVASQFSESEGVLFRDFASLSALASAATSLIVHIAAITPAFRRFVVQPETRSFSITD